MKAIVYKKYGSPDVLELKEVEKPIPRAGEVMVKVYAASVNSYDWRHVRADPFLVRVAGAGVLKPTRIPGGDIAGRVEQIGEAVKHFKPGDHVFGGNTFGGFAEYVCIPEKCLALKPGNLTFEQAAAVPSAALTALQALRYKGRIKSGERILVNGASGGVGTFAVQLAKFFGAHVTGVCSTNKLDLVSAIGADSVIDYKKQDITQCGTRFDRILDIAAYRSLPDYKRILNAQGIYIMLGGAVMRMLQLIALSMTGQKNMHIMLARASQKDLRFLRELLERGDIKPVIDRIYPLSNVPAALWYFERGLVRGKIAISISDETGS